MFMTSIGIIPALKEVSANGFHGNVLGDTISRRKPEDHWAGSWNLGRDQGVWRQRKIRSKRNPMGRRAVLRLAQPLSPVEHDLRPDGRKPRRFRSDSLHLHPLLPSPSARNGGKHGPDTCEQISQRARAGSQPVASMREEYGHAHALQHVTGNTTQDHLT